MPTRSKNGAAAAKGVTSDASSRPNVGVGAPKPPATDIESETQRILRHWRDVVPHDRLAHLVKDAIRALDRALQLRLAEHAVALGHWPFLRVLWQTDGLTQRELSREAGVMEPTTFAAMKAMASLGYVVRRKLADNRRKNHIFLTAKGRALERTLVPLAEEVNRIAVHGAPVDDIAATRRTLLTVLENLARDERHSVNAHRRIPSTRELGRRVDSAERG
jgi:MarR family transcriptional regulator, organic hydroperoxide resistance regulator